MDKDEAEKVHRHEQTMLKLQQDEAAQVCAHKLAMLQLHSMQGGEVAGPSTGTVASFFLG